LADAIMALNDQLALIIDSFGPLKDFTELLNLPTELAALRVVNLERRRQTHLQRDGLLSPHFKAEAHEKPGAAAVSIVVSELSFEYLPNAPILKNITMSIPQGQMVAVTGPHKSGKSSFMQLLAGNLLPTRGGIFVPSHLRVLYISREPIFLHASITHNLSLGLPDPSQIDVQRVCAILRMLGLEEAVVMVEKEKPGDAHGKDAVESFMEDELKFMDSTEASWEQSLSLSFKVRLHIARALIADPEVIIIDRALLALNTESALQVLDVLNQHVRERGLCMPAEAKSLRRPRTVFFSSDIASQVAKADCILQVDPSTKGVGTTTQQAGIISRLTSKSKLGCLPVKTT